MKNRINGIRVLTVLIAMPGVIASAEAETSAPVPYTVDEHTLHLWHLDEAAVPSRHIGITHYGDT